MIEYAAILFLGMTIGWFTKPAPSVMPPQAAAVVLCTPLPAPTGPTLAEVQKSAVDAAVAHREVCLNHKELVKWSERTLDKFD